MKKMMRLTVILVIALMVVVGCSNKNEDNDNENNNSNKEAESNNDDGDQVLQLGETGTMNTTAGEYEVTPTSFVAVEEWENEKPSEGKVFVVIDLTVKNIGESVLEGEDIRKVDAIGGKDLVSPNNQLHDKTNQLEGELKPGEKMEGQLAFSLIPKDTYQLVFGMHKGTVSNKITWELHADDAS